MGKRETLSLPVKFISWNPAACLALFLFSVGYPALQILGNWQEVMNCPGNASATGGGKSDMPGERLTFFLC